MKNLWLSHFADQILDSAHGASSNMSVRVNYKKKGVSIKGVQIDVDYNNGQPIIEITGDPTCIWNIGKVNKPGTKSEKQIAQMMMWDPPL